MPGIQQIPVFPPFAVELVYPAGADPWDATPTKVAPVPDYFLPDTKPPAQWFNHIFNAASASTWYANGAAQTVAALNWAVATSAAVTLSSGGLEAACWEPRSSQWWVAAVTGGNSIVLWTHQLPGDALWVSTGTSVSVTPKSNATPNQAFGALAPDPTTAGKVWLGIVTTATHCSVWSYAAGSYTARTAVTCATGQATVVMHTYNGHVLIGLGSQAAADAKIYLQPDDTTALTGVTASVWRFADNGSVCVAMPAFTTAPATYWTSPDGVTWTGNALGFLSAGEQIFGVVATQDAYGPCFLVGINQASGGTPRFVVSHATAPFSWSPQATTSTMAQGTGMVANDGSAIVVATTDTHTTGFSVDGGLSWYPAYAAALLANNATSTFYEPPTLAGSGVGYLHFNAASVRLSLLEGLPQASM